MTRLPALDHSDFANELSRQFGVSCRPTPKPSKRILFEQNNKIRPKPLGTLLSNLESQLLASSPYARRRGASNSPTKVRRVHVHSPALNKAQLRPPPPAAEPLAVPCAGGLLKPHVRKQVLALFKTWASQENSQSGHALKRPASVGALGRTGESTTFALKGSATHGSLPGLPGRSRASSAATKPSSSVIDAALTAKASSLRFEAVLRLYFRLATEAERQAMMQLVEPQMQRLDKRRWIRRVKAEHIEKIRMAFLMGDKDGDGMLSLSEFGEAVAVHRGERQLPQGLAQIFAAADKDGNGQLDEDEFLDLVASHPKLMSSFEDVLGCAVQRKREAEHAKLAKIFKTPISPTSRVIASPSGLRRRPTLADLRSMQDVVLPDEWKP